jgi:hypothetical protein
MILNHGIIPLKEYLMEAIKNFTTTLELMNEQHVVYFLSPIPNYCVLKNEKIEIINHQTRYVLTLDDFIHLFKQEIFFIHQKKEVEEIDLLKDDEYYGLRYQ